GVLRPPDHQSADLAAGSRAQFLQQGRPGARSRRRAFRHRCGAPAALRANPQICPLYRRRLRRKVRSDGLPGAARGRKHKRRAFRLRRQAVVLMRPATPWRAVLATVVVVLALAILGGFAFIYSGVFSVAATEAHWPVTRWVMETARDRSIKAHAAGMEA